MMKIRNEGFLYAKGAHYEEKTVSIHVYPVKF